MDAFGDSLRIDCLVSEKVVSGLVDSGATASFASKKVVSTWSNIDKLDKSTVHSVELADGSLSEVKGTVSVVVSTHVGSCQLYILVMEKLGNDLILGCDWLVTINPDIDWSTGSIKR